ncbi:MAG: hypothetical protein K9I85_15055 [Saprospiraceae bacterium]|nr:hypothetical protein [Saprospiraceae bacterium]
MKKQLTFLAFLLIGWLSTPTTQAQMAADSTGLPGDNFSLEGALELFKTATSPENYEQLLNDPENNVNNLDLNEDGEVDYIRVIDNMDGDVHALVLQVPFSETENQDIAVIEIEKDGSESALLQIVGDEDIYGEQMIVEPYDENLSSDNKEGPSGDAVYARVVVNVWFWPGVRYIYAPGYTVWVSPWRWRHYPNWYRPWRPLTFHRWHVRVAPYRAHRYHVVKTHRVVRAHRVYTPHRTHAKVVRTRTTTTVKTRKGTVRKTTTKTKVKKRGGNTAVRKKTRVSGRKRGG